MARKILSIHAAPQISYRTLRLVDPAKRDTFPDRFLELGTFRIIENEATVLAVVEAYVKELGEFSAAAKAEFDEKRKPQQTPEQYTRLNEQRDLFHKELEERAVLTFADFNRFVGHESSEGKNEDLQWRTEYQGGSKLVRNLARKHFVHLQHYGGFSKTFAGYRTYLKASYKGLYAALDQELPALVPEEPRRTHTYITSTTKTGKTELLKALCLNYIQQPDYAGVVVLDPGGDMAPQMARWPELIPSAQLVYIDPMLSEYNTPVINPFDAENLNEQDRNLLTEQIVWAIGSLIEGKGGGSLTVNMEAILYPCVRLLVDLPNTSLLDLQALMKDDPELIEAGCKSANPMIVDFFQTEFTQLDILKPTKNSIVVKLRNILGKGVLDKVLCGRTSINLERLMEQRKFIVVNLAKGRMGSSESEAFGTLLVSLIQAIVMKRERIKESERPMTHLIIDECQNFVTSGIKDIIRETRKFGLALTLAQQEIGGEMPKDLVSVVTKTTNVKVAGRSSTGETKLSSSLVGVEPELLDRLEAGQFVWKNGTAPPFLLKVRPDRLKYREAINNDLWIKVANQQQQFFYRANDDEPVRVKATKPSGKKRPQVFE